MDGASALTAFRRASVADQAASALRRIVRSAAWGSSLPGEYEIARRLGIGRYSVRAALAQLADDGLVDLRKGRRPQLRRARPRNSALVRPAVCVVASESFERIRENSVLMQVHAQLAEHGVTWEEVFDAKLGGKRPERRLHRLVEGRHNVCWLLLSCPAPVQRWFALAGVSALIVGSPHPGVRLPSIDTDYRAIGWHVAGRMAQFGHRRLGIIVPNPPAAGDLDCWRGFTGYVEQHRQLLTVSEILVESSPAVLQGKLERLMAGPQPPTALFSIWPENSLTAFCHLLRIGLRIPRDISIVSSDTHSLFETSLPEITRYRTSNLKQARRTVQAIHSLLAGHALAPKPSLIFPSLVAGTTLGPPPDKPRPPVR